MYNGSINSTIKKYVKNRVSALFFTYLLIVIIPNTTFSQTVSFDLKTSANVGLSFDNIKKFQSGIIIPNVCVLNVNAVGTQWDLYVGATTTTPGLWDQVSTYSSNGTDPDVSLVQLQFRNTNNTSQVSGFFPLTDISTPTYIVGSVLNPDPPVTCPVQGTNQAGNYASNPQCYQFRVDLKVVPGFGYKPGLYTLRIDYVIVQDL